MWSSALMRREGRRVQFRRGQDAIHRSPEVPKPWFDPQALKTTRGGGLIND
jgi:hypothetical protein